jgi:hypothetical protein
MKPGFMSHAIPSLNGVFGWLAGIAVSDWHCVTRICNISLSSLRKRKRRKTWPKRR